jgi:hypothetical protein
VPLNSLPVEAHWLAGFGELQRAGFWEPLTFAQVETD